MAPRKGMKPSTIKITSAMMVMAIHMPGDFMNKLQPSAIQLQPLPAAAVRPPGVKLFGSTTVSSATGALGAAYGFGVLMVFLPGPIIPAGAAGRKAARKARRAARSALRSNIDSAVRFIASPTPSASSM